MIIVFIKSCFKNNFLVYMLERSIQAKKLQQPINTSGKPFQNKLTKLKQMIMFIVLLLTQRLHSLVGIVVYYVDWQCVLLLTVMYLENLYKYKIISICKRKRKPLSDITSV